jgi:hypothetical protein
MVSILQTVCATPWVVGFETVRWMLQSAGGRVSQSPARHEYMAGDAKLTQDSRNRSCLDLRDQLGGCKPGDSSHALICEPVSACRAFRISSSRATTGGSCRASSRRPLRYLR